MSYLLQRTFITTCPAELMLEFNENITSSAELVQIINDGSPDTDFWFDTEPTPEDIVLFDALIQSWECSGALDTVGDSSVSNIQNVSGTTLGISTPVFATGTTAEGHITVIPADASDPNKMPAFGVVASTTIEPNGVGVAAISGEIQGMDTSMFSVGDEIYVAPGGGSTNSKPTTAGNKIQKICQILKSDSVSGRAMVIGAGRTNDVPNIPCGQVWMGNPQDVATPTTLNLGHLNIGTPSEGDTIVYDGSSWGPQQPTASGSIIGLSHQLSFGEAGTARNEWLELYGDAKYSNSTVGVMPFKSKLVGITFSNKKDNIGTEIRIYSTPVGGGTTPKTLDFVWPLYGTRTAWKTNFPVDVIFDVGDKIGVYAADVAGRDPQYVQVTLYFAVVDDATGEGSENYRGNFSTTIGGGSR